VPLEGARAVLELAEGGATAPFIARYRRDRTGNLGEPAVRQVLEALAQWERLVARQAIILESIERHATVSDELRERILVTFDADTLEDLYLPFKQKKKSRAGDAREAGLGQLADWIWNCGHGTETPQEGQTLELWAFTFRDADKGVPDAKTAIEGARDILVERLAEDAELRRTARKAYAEGGWLRAAKTEKAKPGGRFEPYFDLHEKVASLAEPPGAQRYLALRRGQSEGELLLSVTGGPDDPDFESRLVSDFEAAALTVPDSPGAEVLRQAARIAFKGHVRTAMENEIHLRLKDVADAAGARAHAARLRRLLREPPFGARSVLGVDPGVRSGSRVAAVDPAGACLASGFFHLQTDEQKEATRGLVVGLAREHGAEAVAIGNGSAGREAEIFVRSALKDAGLDIPVVLVGEGGSAAWGSSETVREELPDLDPPVRAAVFVARRLQDPLRELVRIEPRSIFGRHHVHDISPAALIRALNTEIDSCVHEVGVDLNTAPRPLLARVSGIGPALAGTLAEHRTTNGPFRSRQQLLEVRNVGPEAFANAAGFLRVHGGEHPFDATGVHPEHYGALEAAAKRLEKTPAELLGKGAAALREEASLEAELGRWTREDALRELENAGCDPRGPFRPFAFRDDVRTLEDLKPGMACPGIVTSVASFGAFVDVGVGQDGLVHVSQLGRRFEKDPGDVIAPGERVEVRVLKVDREKKQISFSLKPAPPRRVPAPRRPAPGPGDGTARDGKARSPGTPRGAKGRRPDGPRGRPPRKSGPPPRPERRPAFNNPFAVLAGLKVPRGGKS
jgi:uncharacterized protein